jgi:CBS domain containing-hemolysin-like protein
MRGSATARGAPPGIPLALVVDEYGAIQGLVTPLALLEALVGDLPDAGRAAEPAAVRREDGSWLVDGTNRVRILWVCAMLGAGNR